MASLTEQIKELRERTGAGMLDCKKALEANEFDIEKAIDWLREKGIAKATKKADRIAAEGLATILVKDNDAVIVEINSETDFVAKNELFVELVNKVAEALLTTKPKTVEEALTTVYEGETINDLIVNATARIGEKITLRRFEILTKKEEDQFGSYIHMGGKIAALTVLENTDNAEVAKDIAMQVAASNPQYLSIATVEPDFLEKEKHIQLEAVKNDPALANKPEQALAKIVEGKVNKTLKEICLLEQVFIKQSDLTVAKYVANNNTNVVTFVRYHVGEGMQKREDNFAEEVMNQLKK
ncbi:TPA: elongation factor Ts [bacterium]|jgi:elongation factor Ts|nr:elongation factor Ts [bacterium]